MERFSRTFDSSSSENRPAVPNAIPRILWQTFKTRTLPARMQRATDSWRDRNPGWDYCFATDTQARAAVESAGFGAAYDQLPPGAFRADLWRYCVLYEQGGVYADMDTVCRYPMDRLLGPDDGFVVAHDANPIRLFNAFLCARPKHPILWTVLNHIASAPIPQNPQGLYDITGPGGLAKAATAVLGWREKTVFGPGRYGDLRILRKMHYRWHRFRRVMLGWRTVCLCKYPGYLEDLRLAGGTHWSAPPQSAGSPG